MQKNLVFFPILSFFYEMHGDNSVYYGCSTSQKNKDVSIKIPGSDSEFGTK